jgi:hypothetical protein
MWLVWVRNAYKILVQKHKQATWKIYAQMGEYYDGSYKTNWEKMELTCIAQYVGKWQCVMKTVTLSLYLRMAFITN